MEALTTDRVPTQREIDAYGEAAEKIYEPLRKKLETGHWGEYITIHPLNGDYAVAPMHRAAVEEMRRKYPGVAFFTFRVGYQAVVHFGGSGAVDGRHNRIFS
jgi:hypothetical protein